MIREEVDIMDATIVFKLESSQILSSYSGQILVASHSP